MSEVVVRRQQREVVTNAKLSDQGVDRSKLDTGTSTPVMQLSGVDVILPIACKHGQGRKAVDDLLVRAGTRKSLQQLLQDDAIRHDDLASHKRLAQPLHFRPGWDVVAAKCQRPDTGIDEKGHRRLRSTL